MTEQRKIGIIAAVVLLSVLGLGFIFLNISEFKTMFSNLFDVLFLIIVYAVIPCAPAVILRAVFGVRACRWIFIAATVLAGLCCMIHIFLPESILEERIILYEDASVVVYEYINNWIFVVTQFVLTSSVPVLYCVAFFGNLYSLPFVFKKERSILIAITPSLMFFLSLFIRRVMTKGLADAFEIILDESVLMLFLGSVAFAVWALLLIFVTFMIYKFINRTKTEIPENTENTQNDENQLN